MIYIFLKANVLFNYESYKRIQNILKDDLGLFKEYATIPIRLSVTIYIYVYDLYVKYV